MTSPFFILFGFNFPGFGFVKGRLFPSTIPLFFVFHSYMTILNINIVPTNPMIVVYIPRFLDFVQPESDISPIIDMIPSEKVTSPIILGVAKSAYVITIGYPGVVIINILVIENMQTKKLAAAKVANLNMLVINLSVALLSTSIIMADNENPPNKALTKIN